MKTERIKNSVLNILSNLIPNIILPIVSFFRIKNIVFYYGSAFNGLYQIFMQLVGFLQLSELGFGAAFNVSLYKPLAKGDKKAVNKLYNANKHYQKYVSMIMFFCSLLSFFIMPLFIKDLEVNIFKSTLLFICFSLPYILNQLFNAKLVLLRSMQKEYVFNFYYQLLTFIRIIFSIILISYVDFFSFVIIDSLLSIIVYLISYFKVGKHIKEYITVTNEKDVKPARTTRYVLLHRISTLVSYNTDNIVLSSFVSIVSVSIYNSYMYILTALERIVGNTIMAPVSSFGNMFASKVKYSHDVFKQVFYGAMFVNTIICTAFLFGAIDFVGIWMKGSDVSYQVSLITVFLFVLILYYRVGRRPILLVLESQNLYKETSLGAMLEAITNVILSIILVRKSGMIGVLIGTVASLYLVDFFFKAYYGVKYGLKQSVKKYIYMNIIVFLIFIGNVLLIYLIDFAPALSLTSFIFKMIVICLISLVTSFIVYYPCFKDFKELIKLGIRMIKRGKKA